MGRVEQVVKYVEVHNTVWGLLSRGPDTVCERVECAGAVHRPLGEWAARQRRLYRHGRLPPKRIAMLERVTGWEWGRSNDSAWRARFAALKFYMQRHGTAFVPRPRPGAVCVLEGCGIDHAKLFAWCSSQRNRFVRGELQAERIDLLASLEGWVWVVPQSRWNVALDELINFQRAHGHCLASEGGGVCDLPECDKRNHQRLASWLRNQRNSYAAAPGRRGALSPERIMRLESVPTWTWEGPKKKKKRTQ